MFGLRLDRQSRVIVIAYAVFCAGLVLTSLLIVREVRKVLASAENIYVHPFTVSNQAQDAKLTLMAIRRDTMFAVMSRDPVAIGQAQRNMIGLDARFAAALNQVRAFYQGDMAGVDRAQHLYTAWKPVRDNILDTARRGYYRGAQSDFVTTSTPLYNEIDIELDRVIAISHERAAKYIEEGRAQRDRTVHIVFLVLLGGFAASFLTSATVIHRVRDLVRANEKALEIMAHHDTLTGLPNRQLFSDRFAQALLQAEREQRIAAIMYVDLDRFKAVNDTYGHEAGDHVLVQVSAGFAAAVRRSDTVARLGGDEFVILLLAPRDRAGLRVVANKLIQVASTPWQFQGHTLEVGASVGVAVFPTDARDAETLLTLADEAMYRAKNAGRNQFRFYSEG